MDLIGRSNTSLFFNHDGWLVYAALNHSVSEIQNRFASVPFFNNADEVRNHFGLR
jgi:hypothetical protein